MDLTAVVRLLCKDGGEGLAAVTEVNADWSREGWGLGRQDSGL